MISEPNRKFRLAPTHNPSSPRKRESRGRDPSAGPGPPLSRRFRGGDDKWLVMAGSFSVRHLKMSAPQCRLLRLSGSVDAAPVENKGLHGAGVGRVLCCRASLCENLLQPDGQRRGVVLLRAYQLHEVGRAYDLNTAVLAKPQQGRVAGDDELRLRLHGVFQHPVIVRVGCNGVNSPGRTH